jgi:hypothetical protein
VTYLDIAVDVDHRTFAGASARLYWWGIGRWSTVGGIVAGILVVAMTAQDMEVTAIWFPFAASAFLLFIGVAMTALLYLLPRRGPLSHGRFRFVAGDDGLTVEGKFGHQLIRWDTYKMAYFDGKVVSLLFTRVQGQCIPIPKSVDVVPLLEQLRRIGLLKPTPRSFILV